MSIFFLVIPIKGLYSHALINIFQGVHPGLKALRHKWGQCRHCLRARQVEVEVTPEILTGGWHVNHP